LRPLPVIAAFLLLTAQLSAEEETPHVASPATTATPVVAETLIPTPSPDAPADGNVTLPDIGFTPTATPTFSPTPTPGSPDAPTATPRPTPAPLRYLPPLSLSECVERIDRALLVLPPDYATDPPTDIPVDSLIGMLESATNYLKLRNDLHTTLAEYQWVELGKQDVDHAPGDSDTDTFELDPPVKRISALSFETRRGDVHIRSLAVYDEKGDLRETYDTLRENPRRLLHSLPLREVFHLWRRTTISRIVIEYATIEPGARAEVVVHGGITERPEYIKTALHHLRLTPVYIRTGNWFEARSQLLSAKDRILDFLDEAEERTSF
jgi:hypothetical protein